MHPHCQSVAGRSASHAQIQGLHKVKVQEGRDEGGGTSSGLGDADTDIKMAMACLAAQCRQARRTPTLRVPGTS